MARYFDVAPDFDDTTIAVDEKAAAIDSHELATVHVFFNPYSVILQRDESFVAGQCDFQAVLLFEFFVGRYIVWRHSHDSGSLIGEIIMKIRKGDCFPRTTGRVVFGVEVEYQQDIFEIHERNVATGITWQIKIWRLITCAQYLIVLLRSHSHDVLPVTSDSSMVFGKLVLMD